MAIPFTSGSGERVVLVHGDLFAGRSTFAAQLPLAERWTLVIPDRRGFGATPATGREDFEPDAEDVAALLEGGAHLVGHSYGGVVALLAAARRPEAVRSLAVSEPPALAVARGDPAVEAFLAKLQALWAAAPATEPAEFLDAFVASVGADPSRLPRPLPPVLERNVRTLMGSRPPWEAVIPLDALRAAPFPKLVVSGGHAAAFDAICEAIARGIGADLAVVPGQGHSIPAAGVPFNARLEALWRSAAA